MEKEYIGSQQHWEDSINQDYDEKEMHSKEQIDNREQPDNRTEQREQKAREVTENLKPIKDLNGKTECWSFGINKRTGAIHTGGNQSQYPPNNWYYWEKNLSISEENKRDILTKIAKQNIKKLKLSFT